MPSDIVLNPRLHLHGNGGERELARESRVAVHVSNPRRSIRFEAPTMTKTHPEITVSRIGGGTLG